MPPSFQNMFFCLPCAAIREAFKKKNGDLFFLFHFQNDNKTVERRRSSSRPTVATCSFVRVYVHYRLLNLPRYVCKKQKRRGKKQIKEIGNGKSASD